MMQQWRFLRKLSFIRIDDRRLAASGGVVFERLSTVGELAPAIGFNPPQIQRVGDFTQFAQAGHFHDFRDDAAKFGVAVGGLFLPRLIGLGNGFLVRGISEFAPSDSGGFRPTGSHVQFVIGDGDKTVNQKRGSRRIICGPKNRPWNYERR